MADVDRFARQYLFVDVHQPATAATVADLLENAAAALRGFGEVNVIHLAFDADDQAHAATTSLTIYYERVERRRRSRPDVYPTQPSPPTLRPVD